MRSHEIIDRCLDILNDATVDYRPDIRRMTENRRQALYSFAVAGGLYLVPGPGLIQGIAVLYGITKTYQAARDWAGR